ncbi:T9SS type A sorting domain-containing protein [Paraflavisolibacter sp. H34]|uniref:rhamnogalacturonan lyase family protein n=1 Tax=Huijunlia imazamoxiresistens TaxID=3127457 RepID=UPI003019538C
MKKRIHFFILALVGCLSADLYAQSAVATWPLTSAATTTPTTTGGITASAEGRGPVFPAPTYTNRTLSGTSTSVGTQHFTVNPGGVGTSSTTAHLNGGYVQFAVTPQAGYEFTVNTVSFNMGSAGANSNGYSIEYSLNSDFSSPVIIGGHPGGSTAFVARDVLYPFSFALSGLTIPSDKTLYLRIYAWNGSTSVRTLLLNNLVVSGQATSPKPALATPSVSNLAATTATAGGNVVSDGGSTVTERGLVYGTTANPTTADAKVLDPSGGTGAFSFSLTGLAPYTTYFLRAYATNSSGTAYSENISFTTPDLPDAVVNAPRQMEYLNRGVVAVRSAADKVFVSWRLLGTDPSGIAFNLYRDGVKLNAAPLATSTNYVDTTATNGTYTVRPVLGGVEGAPSAPVSIWGQQYLSIPLQVPAGGTTPDGVAYTYSANDCSVGDVDGDGAYEIFVKWDPSNSKDNSQSGYTGNVYIDCYKMNGAHLWRIDLGRNIRAGAHYTQFMVYDLDGDGKAEMACKTADGTVDGNGLAIGNPAADYRNSSGYILSGPEYLTVFNGQTGAAMATTAYLPARGSVASWGDSYGNRVDRFVAAVAYLDGQRPSLVFGRGYYTRMVRAAWDWRNGQLTNRWVFDSNEPGNGAYAGQGNHQMSIADVDGDGKDEVFNGSSAINDNGRRFWANAKGHGDALHLSDLDPERPGLELWSCHEEEDNYAPYGLRLKDARTGETIFGVTTTGDIGRAMAADIDPRYPGAEMWGSSGGLFSSKGQQISTSRPTINAGIWWDGDLSRELLDAGYNATSNSSTVRLEKWNGATNSLQRLLTPSLPENGSAQTNNTTKANAGLTADLLGDWREEMILRSSDNTQLLVFTTTIPTEHRIYTLMHDPQYRTAIAWQNSAYNQPPHPGFFLGTGMAAPPTPQIAVKDIVAPEASLITRLAPDTAASNATSVTYRVVFTEDVNGVDASDFTLVTTGDLAGTIASVTAVAPAVYEVRVEDLTGEGGLRLDLKGEATAIADASGNAQAGGFTAGEGFTRVKAGQTITFNELGVKAFGAADFDAGATASSDLQVQYSSSNAGVATIINGTVHITGLGTTEIWASQPGDNRYRPAPAVVQVLTVRDLVAPSQPQALTASKTADGKVLLMWQAATDDIGVAGYAIFLNGKQLNAEPITGTSFLTDAPSGSLVYGYTVLASDAAENHSPESATALFSNSNGGGAQQTLEVLKVFPNPNDGAFKVRLNSTQMGTVYLTVTNSNGAVVQSLSEGKSDEVYQRQFNLKGVPKGLYLVRVAVGSFVQTSTVLIQ